MAKVTLDTFTLFSQLPKEIRSMIWERALPGPRVVNLRQRKLKKTIGEWETEAGRTWPPPKEELLGEEYDTDLEDNTIIVDLRESSLWRGRQRNFVAEALRADTYDEEAYKGGHLVGWVSDCPAPEILSVCREAFEVVSKSYQKVFSSLGAGPTTWFCFELDTLYLRYDALSIDPWESGFLNLAYELTDGGFMLLDKEILRRVKKLALLVPKDHMSLEWEGLIAEFSAITGGLDELYLVVKDYQETRDDAESLTIIGPIDIEGTMTAYRSFNPGPGDFETEVPGSTLVRDWMVVVDLPEIRRMLEDDVNDGALRWKIPIIREKVICTQEMAREMESMRISAHKRLTEVIEHHKASLREQFCKRWRPNCT
ncbi:hypothetical protein N431DRAFT_430670 [Stipitochalara longipes BDJ]|nr:hypothetical protein N431DRAFT_430670 [Stipitochalara longipes BDJ]